MIKQYYRETEKIDYVDIFDHYKGVESLFLHYRVGKMVKLIKQCKYGHPFLDVGCGTGAVLRYLPKGSVGMDINPWNVIKAKKYASSAEFVIGDAENLPFKENVFSVVVCTEVLEHLERPDKTIQETHRVLKDNGVLLGTVPHPSFLWRLIDISHMLLSNKRVRPFLNIFKLISSTSSYTAPFHNSYERNEARRLLSIYDITHIWSDLLRLHVFFIVTKS